MAIEFSNGDFHRIENAVSVTRRIRSAGLQGIGALLLDSGKDQQTVFHDAVEVVGATTNLITSYVQDSNQRVDRTVFDATIDEKLGKYDDYQPFTKSDASTEESADLLEKDINRLHENWEVAIDDMYRRGNGLHIPTSQFLHPRTGIIAPLSTDYHRASVHQKYVTDTVGISCFDIAPAIVDPWHEIVVFPNSTEVIPDFSNKKVLGMYIDRPGHGDTKDTLARGIRKTFRRRSLKNGNVD